MMRNVPIALVYSRIVAAAIILLLCWFDKPEYRYWVIGLVVYGVVSDFFDGFIARRIGVSAEKLRRLDSSIDQVFWLSIVLGSYWLAPEFYKNNWAQIVVLVGLEVIAYVISFARFGKEVATHAIASKFWVLTMLIFFIDLILHSDATWSFQLCFWVGVITRLEIIGILLLLKEWVNDVPSIYHALQLRKGKTIKRNKIFNG